MLYDNTYKVFKVKLPPAGTLELDRTYSALFDRLNAGWMGMCGHYGYGRNAASNQDGYIYVFKNPGTHLYRMTCDPYVLPNKNTIPELSLEQVWDYR